MDSLRPKQREILKYRGGRMGVSAVPGSGKTFTLSRLAAKLIVDGGLEDDQEVLIVTLTNSAVENFYNQLSAQLKGQQWFPGFGYRVRTLHGLATDIVRESCSRLGLSENFQILDDREAALIRQEVARAWLASNSHVLAAYLRDDLDEYKRTSVARKDFPALVQDIALAFIRSAKNLRLTPADLQRRLAGAPGLPLAEMGCQLYTAYQRSLEYRGAVDFDDLIVLALRALETDPAFLDRLRCRWPYILEDEAQDSSLLQEQILRLLSGDGDLPPQEVNWVRVGDPNQAIYETFTTANPRFLRQFLARPDVIARDLPNSGRFARSIITLANYLAEWTAYEHPVPAVREALQPHPQILPTPPGDPQPAQPDDPAKIFLDPQPLDSDAEIDRIAASLAKWLPANPDSTAAVLAPTNYVAERMVEKLQRERIPCCDSLLKTSASARTTVRSFRTVLKFLCDPLSSSQLADLFRVWRSGAAAGLLSDQIAAQGAEWLRRSRRVEDFLWPEPGRDPLETSGMQQKNQELHAHLTRFREHARRWIGAMQYPIDQVILTIAHDLLRDPLEWAIAQKLAAHLRRFGRLNPAYRLPDMLTELAQFDRSGVYAGFGTGDSGFNPDDHKGEVTVATMHKAKGLEWDRVYLMSVNAYDFPSALEGDRYRAEKWFFRPAFNIEAETLAQLDALVSDDPYAWPDEGRPSLEARIDVARERLRLLYVGITRARRELVITCNNGTFHDTPPALALTALAAFWDEHMKALQTS